MTMRAPTVQFSDPQPSDHLSYAYFMQVRVRYLGMLKEIAGREAELVELADGTVLAESCMRRCSSEFRSFRSFAMPSRWR